MVKKVKKVKKYEDQAYELKDCDTSCTSQS